MSMLTPRLRRRLSELARTPSPMAWSGIRGGHSAPPPLAPPVNAPPAQAPTEFLPPSLETQLLVMPFDPQAGGHEAAAEGGCCFRSTLAVTTPMADGDARAARLRAAAERLGLPPESLMLLDIETAGLAAAPLFLVGTLTLGPNGLTLTQYFARGYEEEAPLLALFTRSLATCRMVVTFNGETFDLPYLRDRAIYHRLPPPLFPDHLDLLPAARRAYRGKLPNCRLQTLEQYVCGRHRAGDVPGAAIPALYHDFVRTGSWPLLLPVFHHNALDLLTLADLLPRLLEA